MWTWPAVPRSNCTTGSCMQEEGAALDFCDFQLGLSATTWSRRAHPSWKTRTSVRPMELPVVFGLEIMAVRHTGAQSRTARTAVAA